MQQPQTLDVSTILAGTEGTFATRRIFEAPLYEIITITVGPGEGPPPHPNHNGDVLFHVLKGSVTFHIEGATYPVKAGQLIVVPKGTNRNFAGGPEGASVVTVHMHR